MITICWHSLGCKTAVAYETSAEISYTRSTAAQDKPFAIPGHKDAYKKVLADWQPWFKAARQHPSHGTAVHPSGVIVCSKPQPAVRPASTASQVAARDPAGPNAPVSAAVPSPAAAAAAQAAPIEYLQQHSTLAALCYAHVYHCSDHQCVQHRLTYSQIHHCLMQAQPQPTMFHVLHAQ